MATINKEDGVTIIEPEGDITAPVDELKEEIKSEVENSDQVVFDMKNVELIDSKGIGLLIASHNSLKKEDKKLRLKNVNEDITKLMETMRLDKHFEIN